MEDNGVNGSQWVHWSQWGHWVQWGQLEPFGVRFGVFFGVFWGVLFGVPFGVTVGVPFGVQVVLVDDLEAPVEEGGSHEGLPTPVNLKLEWVLGRMPRKVGSVAALINRLLR